MTELIKIQEKWQKRWADAKIFEANPIKDKPKFFLTFPYPYINAYPHIGHLYTLMRIEAFARYKRLRGFNVLFPEGWHATGSPIVNAAKRVKNREEKQIKIMKDMGFDDAQISKFEDPSYWIEFFQPEFKKDWELMGMSVDWRREFVTTSINPHYDKFISWQFNKLKEKDYVIKGKFPVVWCPTCKNAVGDHSRSEGEGETTQEFCLFKFKLDDGRNILTATLRHDTVLGITNVYVNPEIDYVEIKTNGESWIVGEPMIKKLEDQNYELEVIGKVNGLSLVGQKVESFGGKKILVLPASFLDPNYGTGLVHSVPSDSADDLIALQDLQKDDELIAKYNLDSNEVKSIKPIEIFDTPEIGGNSAQHFLDKYEVKSQNDWGKLEKIKKELYKLTFTKSTFGSLYKEGFSENLEGMSIPQGQEIIKRELLEQGIIENFYELTGKVVCRCLTNCAVKIVSDQWFLDYANPEWKKLTHRALDNLKLYPEKARPQFNHVIDWLHEWACTREEGLGTKLPWDGKWLIESLSDSTLYLAYYTIVHILEKLPVDQINDELFDYLFLGLGDKPKLNCIDDAQLDEMKENFNYFFPCDFRNSGKDLIQNHLTFYLFNHAAIFPEDKWPSGIGVNGWVTVDGQKMSKSLGNMIPVREMAKEFSADVSRMTILSGGESLDDPNWDTEFAKSMMNKLSQLQELCTSNYDKGHDDTQTIDIWADSQFNRILLRATECMEETLFRSAIQECFFSLQRLIKQYLHKSSSNPNKKLINQFIEAQLIMLTPFAPHICEEVWEALGKNNDSSKKDFISLAKWPEADESKINLDVEFQVEMSHNLFSDINSVLELAKISEPKKITIFISLDWKYDFFSMIKELFEETRNPGEILKKIMGTDLKQHGKEISKMVPMLVKDPSKIPTNILDSQKELDAVDQNKEFIKAEFKCDIEIIKAKDSQHPKAGKAMPGKPAIVVE